MPLIFRYSATLYFRHGCFFCFFRVLHVFHETFCFFHHFLLSTEPALDNLFAVIFTVLGGVKQAISLFYSLFIYSLFKLHSYNSSYESMVTSCSKFKFIQIRKSNYLSSDEQSVSFSFLFSLVFMKRAAYLIKAFLKRKLKKLFFHSFISKVPKFPRALSNVSHFRSFFRCPQMGALY